METVAFYSYKGGVGRTLLLANTARFLALSGRKVVALDLDLEAPGLHYKLGSALSERAAQGRLRGAVDELLSTVSNGAQQDGVRSIAVPIDLPVGCTGALWLIPAGSAPSPAYWSALEQLSAATRAPDSALLEAVLDLQARIAAELNPDFLLLDSRTGITELGGLATSIVADRVVCMTNTTAESIDGIRMVAKALRQSPRLPDQRPVQLDFLVTRVDLRVESKIREKLRRQLGDSVELLPHDAEISSEEWTLGQRAVARPMSTVSGHNPVPPLLSKLLSQDLPATVIGRASSGHQFRNEYEPPPSGELFAATLDWIARAFPGHASEAASAKKRMLAVRSAWDDLTRRFVRAGEWIRKRDAWPVDQIREGARFGNRDRTRQADLVVYDGPPADSRAKPLMVVEYVERNQADDVARWWHAETGAPVVVILLNENERCLYSRNAARLAWIQAPEPWGLPLPRAFQVLPDPIDTTLESLLDSVRRGHPDYVEPLIAEWVRCSGVTLHGGTSWNPSNARRILDGLAEVDDLETARHVLRSAFPGSQYQGSWTGRLDHHLDNQVARELLAPLCWRLPPEASIAALTVHGGLALARQRTVLDLLARDLLGLTYDPDSLFRTEGQRIIDQEPKYAAQSPNVIYSLSSTFRQFEASFEWSLAPPPLLQVKPDLDEERLTAELDRLITKHIDDQALVTTGLLGDYEPSTGCVVLYKHAIERVAHRLSLRPRHLGSVALLHETLHALMHLGRDLEGRWWAELALSPASSIFFEPSQLPEALAQYFTYKAIVGLQDQALLHAFETLSEHQPPSYRRWRRMKDIPLEQARQWLTSARRGTGEMPALLSDPPE